MFLDARQQQIGGPGVHLKEASARHVQIAERGALSQPVFARTPDWVWRSATQPVHGAIVFRPAQRNPRLRRKTPHESSVYAQSGEQRLDRLRCQGARFDVEDRAVVIRKVAKRGRGAGGRVQHEFVAVSQLPRRGRRRPAYRWSDARQALEQRRELTLLQFHFHGVGRMLVAAARAGSGQRTDRRDSRGRGFHHSQQTRLGEVPATAHNLAMLAQSFN